EPLAGLKGLCEVGEEFVGQFLSRSVDQPLSKLCQFASDLCLDLIAQERTAFLFGQVDFCTALREARNAALSFPRDLVAVRRIEVAQRDLSFEPRRYRPDLHPGDRTKSALIGLL